MRRLLALLALAVSATVILTLPAAAGGPTSVLVTDPATGAATALYYTDPAYDELDRLLAGGETLDSEPSGLGASSVNLTWLIHDVEPWRTQNLFLDAEGGPVVVTYGSEVMGDPGTATWSRVTEAKALTLLADQVLSSDAPASDPAAAPADAPPAPDPVVTERVVTETAWYSLDGWRWLVPGLLAGAGIALLLSRARSKDTGPRQVLVDVEPDPIGLTSQR